MMKVALLCVALFGVCAFALDNGLGRTPAMGWNSWNKFGCGINENLIRQTADAIVSKGLMAAGYKYVNLDDCWQVSRDSQGVIQADSKAFPSGIKALADYVHSKGLKFGVYSDAGYNTCEGRPGSLGHEQSDANTYASWGVDYLKYDNCQNDGSSPRTRYPPMRDALNKTGRPILFSMCEWGDEDPATWAAPISNSWRTTGDIRATWSSVIGNLVASDKWYAYAGPGAFNDPDMLEVGNGMTYDEQVAHFSLWCLVKSPLLIGCDVRSIDSATVGILTNSEALAVSQDALGRQGHRVVTGTVEVWAGVLAGGDVAVVVLNTGSATAASFTARLADLGVGLTAASSVAVRDLWAHAALGTVTGSLTVTNLASHAVKFLRLTPTNGSAPVDPCASVDCGAHGSCTNGACTCKDGYTGPTCNVAPTPAGTICANAHEGSTLALTCAGSTKITAITFANYGTPTGSCPSFTASSCAKDVTALVSSTCLGKNSCSLAVSNNAMGGDPCVRVGKNLAVVATCA